MDPLEPGDPVQVGGHRLLGRLGAGGMGQVYLGRSPGGRLVAIKVIRREHASRSEFRARFAREIEAARRVGGFHTAPIVDADPDGDPPWMVSAYIPGPSLRETVIRNGPLTGDAVCHLGAGLAEGLAAIHACGLVHRDLKPSNVIMAEDGPRIIDFGIAHIADEVPLTRTGSVLGTFAYMSPEQVGGKSVGPAGDVFSLGSVLVFAATGRGPFDADSIPAVVHRVSREPPDLRGFPEREELRDLVVSFLAKEPDGRPGVRDVLTRLAALRDGDADLPTTAPQRVEPVPPTPPDVRTRRITTPKAGWTAGMAVAGAVAAIAVAAAFVIIQPWSGRPAGSARAAHFTPVIQTGSAEIDGIALDPNGRYVATTGGNDYTVRLWSMETGKLIRPLIGDSVVQEAAFSRDGAYLYTGAGDLWNTSTGQKVRRLGFGWGVGLSPDGRTAASGSADNTLRLWDTASGRQIHAYALTRDHGTVIETVAFSPDGKVVAAGGHEGTVRLWDPATGKSLRTLTGAGGYGLAFSRDGRLLATTGDHKVRLWDLATGHLLYAIPDAYAPAISPNGRVLATASGGDYTVRLWKLADGSALHTFTGHTDTIQGVAISRDGKYLAAGSADHTVRLWDISAY